jgi:hypothetical protein
MEYSCPQAFDLVSYFYPVKISRHFQVLIRHAVTLPCGMWMAITSLALGFQRMLSFTLRIVDHGAHRLDFANSFVARGTPFGQIHGRPYRARRMLVIAARPYGFVSAAGLVDALS